MTDAQQWCDEYLGYLKAIGRLTMMVPSKEDEDGNFALLSLFIQCANDQSVVNDIRENGIKKMNSEF